MQSNFVRRALVRAEIEKLHMVCLYLKQMAQVTNKQQILTFDIARRCYMYENSIAALPKQLIFGVPAGVLGPPSAPHRVIAQGVTFPGGQIIFYPTGIVHAGTVYISDTEFTYTYALSCAVSHISYLRKYVYNHRWELIS